MRCHAHRTAGTGHNRTRHNKKPSAICTADISHTSERAWASGVHLAPCAGFESCHNVAPPRDLCVGTCVSHMTYVECSWTILLECECVCFSGLDIDVSALARLHRKYWLCFWCTVWKKPICYILVLSGCACTVTMVMNTALLKHFKITDNLIFILDWNIYCCVCKTVT